MTPATLPQPRRSRPIGRFGSSITVKRKGDWVWDAQSQSYVQIGARR